MSSETGSGVGRRMLPIMLFIAGMGILAATGFAPAAGRLSWFLEVAPALVGISLLVATHRRFPMTSLVYIFVFVHTLILTYGGYYTYAETPLGNWARDAFQMSRNHYDRVGHLALGFFPAIIVREILLRRTPLKRGGWLVFIVLSIVLAVGAFWELIEWWTTLVVAGDVGTAFLGSQGDVWDAQWDMFLALIGAGVSLPLFARAHDRQLELLAPRPSAP